MPPTEPVDTPVDLDETPDGSDKRATLPPAPPRAPRTPASTALVVAIAAAAVFAVTSVLLAAIALGYRGDRDELADERRDVEAAASRFAQAFVDFDSTDIATLRDDVLPLTAEPFTEQFAAGAEQIHALNESLGRSSRATVTEVFVSDVTSDQAVAIVSYDALETYADADPVSGENLYMRIRLTRLNGEWKVIDVINLNLALDGGDIPAPPVVGDETTTTAPPG